MTILIRRPVSEVFDYMDDVSREREWQPNLREARQEPPGPTVVGTRKSYVSEFMGRRVENTYVAQVVEPSKRVAYETTRDSAVHTRSEVRWEATAEGTRVTMTVESKPSGFLRLVPRRVLESTYRQELASTMDRLKACLERPGTV